MRGVQPATAVRVAFIVVLMALLAPPVAAAATFDFGLQDCECHGIGVGADGSIYVGDAYRDRLVKFSPSGTALASFFRPAGAGTAFDPWSTAAAPGGNLVGADSWGAKRITPAALAPLPS